MTEQDDELIELFIEESKEHLDGIEDSLLTLEEQGENVDEELINKVFRAIHSIKGAAGFFGLDNTKQLAHSAENVLGKIRKRELVPSKSIVAVLLDSVDVLNSMMNAPDQIGEVDISQPLTALERILNGTQIEAAQAESTPIPSPTAEQPEQPAPVLSSPAVKPAVSVTPPTGSQSALTASDDPDMINVSTGNGELAFVVPKKKLGQATLAPKGGEYVYVITFDPKTDLADKNKTVDALDKELKQLVHIIDGEPSSNCTATDKPFHVLVSTIMDPDLVTTFFELSAEKVCRLDNDLFMSTPAVPAQPTAVSMPSKSIPQPVAKPRPAIAQPPSAPSRRSGKTASTKTKSEGSIRVNVRILDRLMTLAGEMVLTRNQLLQNLQSQQNDVKKLEKAAQRVDTITTELQDAIMSTRMQSVGIVFNKFRRVVHDMSRDLGKEIELELEGEDVELDKTIIEAIGDPLTHLVRNAIDHGIEMPAERTGSGKSSCGTLKLSAFHKAGQVIIEVSDDGRGLDPAQIKEKAVAMGLYTPQELYAMPDQSILRLIFKPGFSTAKEVTDISGRGVGMDVVSSNLSNIGGVVDLESEMGKGTTIRIKLPLTLAILPSLMVAVGGEHFAIPQMNLLELQRIPAAKVTTTIEKLGSVNVMRLRGQLLPLVDLRDVLHIPKPVIVSDEGDTFEDERQQLADRREPTENKVLENERRKGKERRHRPSSAVNIAVVSAGEFNYGIIVDTLLDSEEIVVKPLGRHLSDCRSYAGATVLGNGHAALILDVVGISQAMELMDTAESEMRKRERQKEEETIGTDRQSLLLIENARDEILAIPLGLVERVEKVQTESIEMVAGRRTIKYRGGSLMLFSIEQVVNVAPMNADSQYVYVIVSKIAGREAGIMCSSIVDTIDADIRIDEVTHRQPGVFGSAIIADRITLLLDIHTIVTSTIPDWIQPSTTKKLSPRQVDNIQDRTTTPEELDVPWILIVEDSKFFMNQIKSTIESAGYNVLTAEDGQLALQVLRNHHVDLVLTDIEMPNLDGFGLVEQMRADQQLAHIPAIAVTSVMGEVAETRSREVGIDDYLIKLDRDQILERSHYFLDRGRSQA